MESLVPAQRKAREAIRPSPRLSCLAFLSLISFSRLGGFHSRDRTGGFAVRVTSALPKDQWLGWGQEDLTKLPIAKAISAASRRTPIRTKAARWAWRVRQKATIGHRDRPRKRLKVSRPQDRSVTNHQNARNAKRSAERNARGERRRQTPARMHRLRQLWSVGWTTQVGNCY